MNPFQLYPNVRYSIVPGLPLLALLCCSPISAAAQEFEQLGPSTFEPTAIFQPAMDEPISEYEDPAIGIPDTCSASIGGVDLWEFQIIPAEAEVWAPLPEDENGYSILEGVSPPAASDEADTGTPEIDETESNALVFREVLTYAEEFVTADTPKKTEREICDNLYELRRMKFNEIAAQNRFLKYLSGRYLEVDAAFIAYQLLEQRGDRCQHVVDYLERLRDTIDERIKKEEKKLELYDQDYKDLDAQWKVKNCGRFPAPKRK